jgi:hypothetical protein
MALSSALAGENSHDAYHRRIYRPPHVQPEPGINSLPVAIANRQVFGMQELVFAAQQLRNSENPLPCLRILFLLRGLDAETSASRFSLHRILRRARRNFVSTAKIDPELCNGVQSTFQG